MGKKMTALQRIEAEKAKAAAAPKEPSESMDRTEYNRLYQAASRRALAALRFAHEDEYQELFEEAKRDEGI